MPNHQGPWKEGRVGGVSLAYVNLEADDLAAVAAHHAAVGIRATVAADPDTPGLAEVATRNWDLALRAGHDQDAPAKLTALDGKPERGIVITHSANGEPGDRLYRLSEAPGTIDSPPATPPDPLPSLVPPTELASLQRDIEAVMATHGWVIYRFDADTLAAFGRDQHAALLRWLGDHHARIWCAPVRDLRAFLLS